jgi:tetratricopeptide (TPR) repeat protein
MNNLFVVYNGRLWVPFETTLVGSSFTKAWEKGSTSYYQWLDKGLTTLEIRKAWQRFKPASLPATPWRPAPVNYTVIEQRYPGELSSIKRIELKLKSRKYYEKLAKKPGDIDALMQIGIIYGQAGLADEAMKAFEKILQKEKTNAAALNNKANILFLSRRYKDAIQFYQKAGAMDSQDALIWVNLARSYLKVKNAKKAQQVFRKAYALDSKISSKYRMMALELLNTL